MKKVKVMLTAIGILAIVGGALAFKARTFGQSFCTRALDQEAGTCAAAKYVGKIAPGAAGVIYYTSPADNVNSCTTVQCTNSTRLTSIE
jgi:hypothetical protein